jgi:ribosomal protein L27
MDQRVYRVGNLGSGSDYTVFSHVLGVPSVDLYYDYQEVN